MKAGRDWRRLSELESMFWLNFEGAAESGQPVETDQRRPAKRIPFGSAKRSPAEVHDEDKTYWLPKA